MSIGRKIFNFGALMVLFASLGIVVSAQENDTEKTPEKSRMERKQGKAGERGQRRGMRRHRRGALLRGLRQVNLTETQKSQMKVLIETDRNANQGLREEMKALMMKRRDGSQTEADRERMQELRTQMRQSREQLKGSILNLLTVEQKQQLEQMKQERRERMERRRQQRQERMEMRKSEQPTDKDN